jgi:hypothetical protein
MKQFKAFILNISFLTLLPVFPLFTQTYKFQEYGIEDGICHPFVYTINQDASGYLWLGTGDDFGRPEDSTPACRKSRYFQYLR